MIYEIPRFAPGGDRYIEVELGDEMSFDLNFQVHTLAAAIRAAQIDGIIELIPELASLQISYDPDRISFDDVIREVVALHEAADAQQDVELESRLFYIPVLYFDPWTEECINDYCRRVTDKTPDADLICELNGIESRTLLRRRHCATEYWVAALGFWPGLCSLMPLDPRCHLVAPKYNPPRAWTPKGAVGLGGAITCIYPDRTPGGYQLLGRTPVPSWDRQQRLPAFHDSLALFRAGDRVRFIDVDRDEFAHVDRLVSEGTYEHSVVEYQKFSLKQYRQWIDKLGSPS